MRLAQWSVERGSRYKPRRYGKSAPLICSQICSAALLTLCTRAHVSISACHYDEDGHTLNGIRSCSAYFRCTSANRSQAGGTAGLASSPRSIPSSSHGLKSWECEMVLKA